jgi:hypothetical protein
MGIMMRPELAANVEQTILAESVPEDAARIGGATEVLYRPLYVRRG